MPEHAGSSMAYHHRLQILEWQILSGPFGKALFKMLAAYGDVPLISPYLNLFALSHWFSVRVDPQHHRRLTATMANRFNFMEGISPGHEMVTAFKEIALKIRS